MKYIPSKEFLDHLKEQGIKRKKFNLDDAELEDTKRRFALSHADETEDQIHHRAAYYLIWNKHGKQQKEPDWLLRSVVIFGSLIFLELLCLLAK